MKVKTTIYSILFTIFIYTNAQPFVIKYTYDSQNRIKTATFPNGNSETYFYDKVGNRTSQVNVINTPTAIENNSSIFEDFKVYPNPTDGLFNISGNVSNASEFTITIYDNTGKLIKTSVIPNTNSFNHEMNISILSTGAYFVTTIEHPKKHSFVSAFYFFTPCFTCNFFTSSCSSCSFRSLPASPSFLRSASDISSNCFTRSDKYSIVFFSGSSRTSSSSACNIQPIRGPGFTCNWFIR